jgi:hypothetical protein
LGILGVFLFDITGAELWKLLKEFPFCEFNEILETLLEGELAA